MSTGNIETDEEIQEIFNSYLRICEEGGEEPLFSLDALKALRDKKLIKKWAPWLKENKGDKVLVAKMLENQQQNPVIADYSMTSFSVFSGPVVTPGSELKLPDD